MLKQNFIINNPDGLHVKQAGVFAKGMAAFKSNVTIIFDDKSINGKSLLAMLSTGIKCGDEILLEIDGEDEDEALKCAAAMIESGLDE